MMRVGALGKVGLSVAIWLLAVSVNSGRAEIAAMTDAEKRDRIEALYENYRKKFPQVEGISAGELLAAMESGADLVLVDVREPAEQAVSMIPGAITRQQFEERAESLRSERIVTYCTAGYRSGRYAEKLRKRGWQVQNLEGSLLSWTHVDGPLVDSRGPTRRLHVYSADWSLEASDYEPVW